jgi:flagellar basal-body rod modification protein FlgD
MPSATSSINATSTNYSSLGADDPVRLPSRTLNQDDFLKLLTTQLVNQDPMNPQQDAEFIAQMAQFGSLEQTRSMSTTLDQLRNDQELLRAGGLIERTVELQTDSETTVRGVVEAMRVKEGIPVIVVNGQDYELSQVLTVMPAPTPTQ